MILSSVMCPIQHRLQSFTEISICRLTNEYVFGFISNGPGSRPPRSSLQSYKFINIRKPFCRNQFSNTRKSRRTRGLTASLRPADEDDSHKIGVSCPQAGGLPPAALISSLWIICFHDCHHKASSMQEAISGDVRAFFKKVSDNCRKRF